MEWFILIIPILNIFILYTFFKDRTVLWEYILPLLISLLTIFVTKAIIEKVEYADEEFLSDAIKRVEYYEPWNEYIHRTCTRSCGKRCTTTYNCSYVQYHSAKWQAVSTKGNIISIDKYQYERLKKRYGNSKEVELNRHYYTIDGDMHMSVWNNSDITLEQMVISESYENRVAVTHSVFDFREVTDSIKNKHKLFDYPNIYNNYKHQSLLIDSTLKIPYKVLADNRMEILNARLGPLSELKCFVLIYKSSNIETGILQEHYWKGGNKNEMVITIGVDDSNKPLWCHPFSWTEKHDDEINIRDHVMKYKSLDLVHFTEYLQVELKDFDRKDFHDFDYLSIDLSLNHILIILLITIISCIAISLFVIHNNFHDRKDHFYRKY